MKLTRTPPRNLVRLSMIFALAAATFTGSWSAPASAGEMVSGRLSWRCMGKVVTIAGTDQSETLRGTEAADVIHAFGGNDVIYGLGGDDIVCAGPGDDVVFTGDGADVIVAGRGNDVYDGGPGLDLTHYGKAPAGVYADLRDALAWDGWGYLDTTSGIENLVGSRYRDKLFGGLEDNVLQGGRGNDDLYGGGGFDQLDGGFDGEVNVCSADADDIVLHCS